MTKKCQNKQFKIHDERADCDIARRRFWTRRKLKFAAVCGAIAAGLNIAVAETMQDRRPPEILSIISNPQSRDFIVAIDGMGGEGTDLFCTLDAFDSRNVYGIYHRGRVDMDYVTEQLLAKIKHDNAHHLTVSGTSEGGLEAVLLTERLIDAGVDVPELHIVTSPISKYDVRSGVAQGLVSNSWVMKFAGIAGRLGVEVSREATGENETPIDSDVLRAMQRTIYQPNRVIGKQGGVVNEGISRRALKKALTAGTRIVYFAPQHDTDDHTVNTAWAYQRLRMIAADIFLELGNDEQTIRERLNEQIVLVRAGADHALLPHAEADLLQGGQGSLWYRETNAPSANDATAIMGYKYMAEKPGSPFAECAPSYNSAGQSLLAGEER